MPAQANIRVLEVKALRLCPFDIASVIIYLKRRLENEFI